MTERRPEPYVTVEAMVKIMVDRNYRHNIPTGRHRLDECEEGMHANYWAMEILVREARK